MSKKKTKMVTVKVMQADIEDGYRGMCGLCPLALALSRAMRKEILVSIGCYWVGDKPKNEAALPPIAETFRYRFDKGQPVAPFTFEAKRI